MYDARLRETLPRVRERIRRSLERAGRSDDVGVVTVTKGHPVAAAEAALAAGLTRLGENRVGELEQKRGLLGDRVEWHMIGHLQRNKVRQALPLFDTIHSIDSLRLARRLSKEAERADTEVSGYVQVNVSGEETKGGFDRENTLDGIGALLDLPRLRLLGLMTMAPWTEDEAVLRTTFGDTRRLLESARDAGLEIGSGLSMGMSNDFEIAVEEGATVVRLGTVLLGERAR